MAYWFELAATGLITGGIYALVALGLQGMAPARDVDALARLAEMHRRRVALLALGEGKGVVRVPVEAPAVHAVPGRVRVARGCGAASRRRPRSRR